MYVSLTVDKKSKSVVQGYNVVGSGAYSGAYLQGYTDTLFYANSGAVNFECWYLNRDGTWSYYKTDLPVQNDWVQADGEWYFFNGAGIMWTGWLDWNGYKYYMRSCKEWDKELKIYVENGGQMTVGWKKIADKWYYFKSHIVNGEQKGGQMVTGWRQIPESDNKYFYFYSDGEMAENVLIEYKGDYYFLKDGGYMAENEEISDPKTNKKYKADSTGICTEIGGNKVVEEDISNVEFIKNTVWEFFSDKFTQEQTAGIMGNIMQESTWNPLCRDAGRSFWGLTQINKNLSLELETKYKAAGLDMTKYGYDSWKYHKIGDEKNIPREDLEIILDVQLNHIYNCRPTDLDWISKLNNTSSVEEATECFLIYYEAATTSKTGSEHNITHYSSHIGRKYQEAKKRREYALKYYNEYAN